MKKMILNFIYWRLARVARIVLSRHKPVIIAITGSVGKTSTKEALRAVLKEQFSGEVRATSGNLNAEIGVPLTILGYTEQPSRWEWPMFLIRLSRHLKDETYPKYLILEMGVEGPSDIDYFCSIAKPTYAIITAATPAHLANFKSLRQMQAEKVKLSGYVDSSNLFYNLDDEYLARSIRKGNSYSTLDPSADIFAESIEVLESGNKYTLSIRGEKNEVNSNLIGEQMICADLAAAGVAKTLGLSIDKIKDGLEKRSPYPGRMNLLPGKDGIKIIDDTYNANPASVKAAARTLNDISYPGRKVFVLGNMNELGEIESREHYKVALYLNNLEGINKIIFAGPNAQNMIREIKDKNRAMAFASRRELDKEIRKILFPGDLVLFKASQNNNYFEESVKLVLDSGIDAKDVLVRQSGEWLKKK